MSISRRSFISLGGLTALVSTGLAGKSFGNIRRLRNSGGVNASGSAHLMSLEAADFERQVGTTFYLFASDVLTAAVLTNVTVSSDTAVKKRKNEKMSSKCFSLRFETLSAGILEQATYDVQHDALGSFPLFMVPGEGPAGEPLLHAVLNRS